MARRLTPLFLQSNFGIVTACVACVLQLLRRPEALHILYAALAADRLVPALAVLKRLRSEHALDAIIKLYTAIQLLVVASAGAVSRSMGLLMKPIPWVRQS